MKKEPRTEGKSEKVNNNKGKKKKEKKQSMNKLSDANKRLESFVLKKSNKNSINEWQSERVKPEANFYWLQVSYANLNPHPNSHLSLSISSRNLHDFFLHEKRMNVYCSNMKNN